MKTLLLLIFMNVSQHALAVVMEVFAGEKSILLPCQYSGLIPEDEPTVMWTRSDLHPTSVHLLREAGADLRGQNQRYRGRTSVRSDALKTRNFSLTLREPQLTDSGSYTCSIGERREELKLRDIQLQVKDQQVEVKVHEGSEAVILPCKTTPDLPEDSRVEWTRSDRELMVVHVYSNKSEHLGKQHCRYFDRTKMNEDLLRTGDLSLTLSYPTERDTGEYICTIYRDKDILRQKVLLQVKERFTAWTEVLLVPLVFVLLVFGGVSFYFYRNSMPVIKVEVGAESVRLPFKTTKNLPEDVKVIWERYGPTKKVHVYHKGSDQPKKQDPDYSYRTSMNKNPLKTGDLSLTLRNLKEEDGGEYKCLVWQKGAFIRTKAMLLSVRGGRRGSTGGALIDVTAVNKVT